MNRYILILLSTIILSVFQVSGTWAQETSLSDVCNELDEAIERTNEYQHKKEQQIEGLNQKVENTADVTAKYKLLLQVCEAYESYNYPKAMEYLNKCMKIIQQAKNTAQEQYMYTRFAYQSAQAGFYAEAQSYLGKTVTTSMTPQITANYQFVQCYTYGELATHSSNKEMAKAYNTKAQQACTAYLTKANKNSKEYYLIQVPQYLRDNKINEAFQLCQQWEKSAEKESKEYATMAYYMSECWRLKKNTDKQNYWLGISAVNDVKNAVMNQTTFWTLAEILNKTGDTERAQRYIAFSMKCDSLYGAPSKTVNVVPMLTDINNKYRDDIEKKSSEVSTRTTIIIVLAILLVLSIFVKLGKKMHQNSAINNANGSSSQLKQLNAELQRANERARRASEEAHEANEKLREANERIKEANARTQGTNMQTPAVSTQLRGVGAQVQPVSMQIQGARTQAQVANTPAQVASTQTQVASNANDEYIAFLLSLCTGYIDKMDNYRLKINTMLKANQTKEALKATGSEKLRDSETKELFASFDEIFLKLNPNFVEEFNSLLLPAHQQKLGRGHSLTTDMRMAALIRLGIDDSASIAEFLQLSPNTVYNYRARLKSKAFDREMFEENIKNPRTN